MKLIISNKINPIRSFKFIKFFTFCIFVPHLLNNSDKLKIKINKGNSNINSILYFIINIDKNDNDVLP